MKFSGVKYLVKESFRSLWVNRMMSLASIGTLLACLILIGVSVLFSLNINSLIGHVENQNEVVVFLKMDVDEAGIEKVRGTLEMMDNVDRTVFISKEEGLRQQMEIFGEDKEYFEALLEEGENPIPDSFRVTLKNVDLLDAAVESISEIEEVDVVSAPEQVAGIITGIKRAAYVIGIVLAVILVVVSFLIISNTIRVTVFNRRKEINIMKYVGATDGFIQFPFILEGIIIGLIAGVLAFGIIAVGYDIVLDWMRGDVFGVMGAFASETIEFKEIAGGLFAGFCIGSAGIGMVGSAIFVRKYLKV